MTISTEVYRGVTIQAEDSEKAAAIRRAIDATHAVGYSLDGIRISSTQAHDSHCEGLLGYLDPENKEIFLHHGTNWQQRVTEEQQHYPLWAEKVYSGDLMHLPLHEIGHAVHHQVSPDVFAHPAVYQPFPEVIQQELIEELGHPYPATSPAELVAEMFAAKVGGAHTFPECAEQLYQMYKGPPVCRR